MSDTFTETTSRSWFTRIKSALGGVVTGFILVVAAVSGLFWNEGRAVKTATALHEGAGQVVTIDPAAPGTQSNGRLVHFSGALTPQGIPQDSELVGISAPAGSTTLIRTVEMYQWKQDSKSETRKKLGGGEETVTTYSYSKTWSDRPIDSSRFKQPAGHENPSMPLLGETFTVESGTVGTVKIKGSDFSGLAAKTPLPLSDFHAGLFRDRFGANRSVVGNGSRIDIVTLPGVETIGDMRVSYQAGDVETLTAIGKLEDGEVVPFEASNGRKISMFRSGEVAAKQMFDDALSGNTIMTWGLRLAGFLAMLVGFKMMFSVIGVLGDVVPFIGDVFRFATGLAALALTAVLSTLTIGIAWIYFRPLLGTIIIVSGIVIAVAALVLGKAKARRNKASVTVPAA